MRLRRSLEAISGRKARGGTESVWKSWKAQACAGGACTRVSAGHGWGQVKTGRADYSRLRLFVFFLFQIQRADTEREGTVREVEIEVLSADTRIPSRDRL